MRETTFQNNRSPVLNTCKYTTLGYLVYNINSRQPATRPAIDQAFRGVYTRLAMKVHGAPSSR